MDRGLPGRFYNVFLGIAKECLDYRVTVVDDDQPFCPCCDERTLSPRPLTTVHRLQSMPALVEAVIMHVAGEERMAV